MSRSSWPTLGNYNAQPQLSLTSFRECYKSLQRYARFKHLGVNALQFVLFAKFVRYIKAFLHFVQHNKFVWCKRFVLR